MIEFPLLYTSRCVLRRIVAADIYNIYQGLSHPQVIKYYGISYDSLSATQVQMDWYAGLEKSASGLWWAICTQNDASFLGAAGLYNRHDLHRKAELGFWFLPEYWGQGLATESLQAILDYAFYDWHVHRIEAQVEPENLACIKVLNKLKFSFEGTLRDCEIKAGRFISLHIFARLSSDQ